MIPVMNLDRNADTLAFEKWKKMYYSVIDYVIEDKNPDIRFRFLSTSSLRTWQVIT